MGALIVGPFEGVTIAAGAIALPDEVVTTPQALAHTTLGRAMSAERRAHAAAQLDAWLGLSERRWSYSPGDPTPRGPDTAMLATQALREALARAALPAAALDLVLVCTSTPHRFTGTVASAVGGELEIHAPCVDLRAGCSSGIFALMQAAQHLAAGARHVAIVGADTFSAVCSPEHRMAACALADGAGALVLTRGAGTLRAACFETDGALRQLVSTPGQLPPNRADLEAGAYLLSGDQEGLEAQIPHRYKDAIGQVLGRAGLGPDALDWFIPHQTARPSLEAVCAASGITPERLWCEGIARHANIGAAGWIAGLIGAMDSGQAQRGQTVLSASVGGGMSWGAALWTL